MDIRRLVESSKGVAELSIQDMLMALMVGHLAENKTFQAEQYKKEVLELKAALSKSVADAIEKHEAGILLETLLNDRVEAMNAKIDYHLNAMGL